MTASFLGLSFMGGYTVFLTVRPAYLVNISTCRLSISVITCVIRFRYIKAAVLLRLPFDLTSWPRNKTDRQIRYETSLSCRESQRRCTTDVVVKGVRPSPLRGVTIGARRGSVNFSKPYCFRLYILGDCDWSDDVRVCTGENAHRHPECDDCTLGKTVGF